MKNYWVLVGACVFFVNVQASLRGAPLDLYGYRPERHDRFYVSADPGDPAKDFVGEGYDFSGVGKRDENGWWHTTLISDRYFLTAWHVRPGDNANIRFYEDNTPESAGTYWESETDSSYERRIDGTDLMLGRLNDPAPAWVKRYPLLDRHSDTNYLPFVTDKTLLIYGQGDRHYDSTTGATTGVDYTAARIGRNEISGVSSGSYSTFTNEDMTFTYDSPSQGGLGEDEAKTVSGNSSAPSFAITPSGLAIAGIHHEQNNDTPVMPFIDIIKSHVETDSLGSEGIRTATDLFGDINSDFKVNLLDLDVLSASFGAPAQDGYYSGDLDSDSVERISKLHIAS